MSNSEILVFDGVGYVSAYFCIAYIGIQKYLDSRL